MSPRKSSRDRAAQRMEARQHRRQMSHNSFGTFRGAYNALIRAGKVAYKATTSAATEMKKATELDVTHPAAKEVIFTVKDENIPTIIAKFPQTQLILKAKGKGFEHLVLDGKEALAKNERVSSLL